VKIRRSLSKNNSIQRISYHETKRAGRILGGLLVATLLVLIPTLIGSGSIHQQLNVAKNIGTCLDTVLSLPYDSHLICTKLHGYSVMIQGNTIEVSSRLNDPLKATHFFTGYEGKQIEYELDNSGEENKKTILIVAKVKDSITITER
jgi:hypothetical protein